MLTKKLLTLACALGILACGACFLPPLPTSRPTAPPLPVYARWREIHSVRVVASDVSDSHHLDGDDLAMRVANRLNWMTEANGGRIRAFAGHQPANEDAVLELKVEQESATPWTAQSTQNRNIWSFSIGVSVSLTDRNGLVRWQDEEPAVLFKDSFPKDSSIDIWTQRGLNGDVPWFLGDRVAHLALYQR